MKNGYPFFLCLLSLVFFSCQNEKQTIELNSVNSFTKSAPLSDLIKRVSQNETSLDNVLDNTSCFSVKLPVSLTVDSQYVTVTNSAGYETIKDIKDGYSNDDDIVEFNFPITIVYKNFQEVVISNQAQYNSIFSQCSPDGSLNEITCIDFNFPISISKYNSNNQVASSITVQNNNQLYNFVNNVDAGEIVGIVYPLTLTKSNSSTVVVSNNTELETAIESVIGYCNNSGSGSLVLAEVLVSGTWHVSYFYSDHDETFHYTGYNFNFNTNETCVATKVSTTINGNWDIQNEGTYQRFYLNYDGSVLYEMESNWKVLEFSATNIRLKKDSGSEAYYLNFTKN